MIERVGAAVYLIGAGVTYLLAMDLLNVDMHLRRWVAIGIAAFWLALLIIALIFMAVDTMELAWRKRKQRGER